MGRVLLHYMSQRLNEINLKTTKKEPGPVVTFSRAAGCSCYRLAKMLEVRLNEFYPKSQWQVISKEILHQSAEQLKIQPDKVEHLAKTKERSLMEEIVNTFLSSDYQLEKKVQKTLVNVIRNFANEGNKIIIGRGGCVICSDIEKAVHVRIDAPMSWKIDQQMNKKGFTREEAIQYIEETESNRSNFRQTIKGKKECCEMYDLLINQSRFSDNEIVELVLAAIKKIV
jgi:cytidylate kinase